MKSIKIGVVLTAMGLATTQLYATGQLKNAQTETVTIEGGTAACKQKIEQAGFEKRVSELAWDAATKKARLTYNNKATSKAAVLKKIALAGFDNELYNAPAEAYSVLDNACQYKSALQEHHGHQSAQQVYDSTAHGTHQTSALQTTSKLEPLYAAYFELSEALAQSDTKAATQKTAVLESRIKAVKMEELTNGEHTAWMKNMKEIEKETAILNNTGSIEKQRTAFATLSNTMYTLMQASKSPYKIFYNHCPMFQGGAYWLSKQSDIRNPYYGTQMLTCGSNKTVLE